MKCVFFTKMIREVGVDALPGTLHEIGADGADLCVRDGYPVNPANAHTALPQAAERLRAAGMIAPLVSAATDLTSVSSGVAETLFAACHDAAVPNLKLGYWAFRGPDYWKQVDAARRDIENLGKLAARYGVKACLHTHSGNNLGLNASSIMHLARGFDPAHIGVYLDPGHLALCGEPPAMAVSIAADHLALVAVKDSHWELVGGGKPPRAAFGPVGDGLVDWRGVAAALSARHFDGPISFHSEYEGLAKAQLLEQTRKDIAFIRPLFA